MTIKPQSTTETLTDKEFYARGLARSRYHDRLFAEGRPRPTNEQFDEGWAAARTFYATAASTAPVVEIAHVCTNGVYRPYPAVLCSSCKYVTHGLSVKELCERLNAAATAAEQSAINLDPLEFWCDLVEVLGHPRPVKVNPVSVIAEVEERLRQIPPTKKHADVADDETSQIDRL